MKPWKCTQCGKTFTTPNDAQPFPMTCNECRAANKPDFSQFRRPGTPSRGGAVLPGGQAPAGQPRQSPPHGGPRAPQQIPMGIPMANPMANPVPNQMSQQYGSPADGSPLPLPTPSAPADQKVHTSSVTQMMRRTTPSRTNLPVAAAQPAPEQTVSGRRRSTSVVGSIAAEANQRTHARNERAKSGKGANRAVILMFVGATLVVVGVGVIILINLGSSNTASSKSGGSSTAITTSATPPAGGTKPSVAPDLTKPSPTGPSNPATPTTTPAGPLGPPLPTPSAGPKILTPYEELQLKRQDHPDLVPPTVSPAPPAQPTVARPTERGELVLRLDAAGVNDGVGTWSRTTFAKDGDVTYWSWTAQKTEDQYPYYHLNTPLDFGSAAYIRIRYKVSGYSKPILSIVVNDQSPELNVWSLPIPAGSQNQWIETEQRVTGLEGQVPEIEIRPNGDAEVGMTIAVDWLEIYRAREIGAVPDPAPAPAPGPVSAPTPNAPAVAPDPANVVTVVLPTKPAQPVAAADAAALLSAAEKGDLALIQKAVEANPGVLLIRDSSNYSLLHLAARRDKVQIIRYLLSVGMSPNLTQRSGRTPLEQAAEWDHMASLQLLIDNGAKVNAPDDEGRGPLYWATHMNHLDIVLELLRRGANPNQVDTKDGQSPLHAAALEGYAPIAKSLRTNGADPTLRDNNHKTPVDLATAANHPDVAAVLSNVAPSPVPAPAPAPLPAPAFKSGTEIIHLHATDADSANGHWQNTAFKSEEDTTLVTWLRSPTSPQRYPQFLIDNPEKFPLGAKIRIKIRLRYNCTTTPVAIKLYCNRDGQTEQLYGYTEKNYPNGAKAWDVLDATISGTPGQLSVIEIRIPGDAGDATTKIDIDSVAITAAD